MTDWRERAACRTADPELFFADSMDTHNDKAKQLEKDALIEQAKTICRACPVMLICLDYAHDHNLKDGIWGSLTDKERAAEKKRRPKRPARCDMCGGHYQPTGHSQRYCGRDCQLAAQRKRQNAWDQNHRAERRAYKNRRKQEAVA